MNNTLLIIETAEAMINLVSHLATEIAAASEAIRTAQAEGRDNTDEEVARFADKRQHVVDAWHAGESDT